VASIPSEVSTAEEFLLAAVSAWRCLQCSDTVGWLIGKHLVCTKTDPVKLSFRNPNNLQVSQTKTRVCVLLLQSKMM